MTRTMSRSALRLLAVMLLLLGQIGPCLAHAGLLSASPPAGARIARAPDVVELVFNEPVRAIVLQLRDSRGRVVAEGATPGDDPAKLLLRLPPDLPSEVYLVGWRVTSIDGHVVGGTHAFVVGDAAADPAGALDVTATALHWPKSIARWLYLLGAIAGGGTILAALVLHRDRAILPAIRRPAAMALLIGIAAAIWQLWLSGVELSPTPPVSIFDPGPFAVSFPTDAGSALLVGGAAMLLLLCLVARRLRTLERWLAGLAILALFVSFGFSGHAATASPRLAMGPILVLHAVIGAFWLGALWPLLHRLRAAEGEPARLLDDFGRMAMVAVPLLLLAAGILLARQLVGGSIEPASPWVLAMMVKLLAVGGLLVIGARNRLVLVPALRQGAEHAADRLRRMLRVDLALAALVIGGTAVMATNPPPRLVQPPILSSRLELRASRAHVRLTMRLASDRAGANRLELEVRDAAGAVIDAPEVWLLLEPGMEGIEAFRAELVRRAPGAFAADDLVLAPAGTWSFEAVVLVDDFTSVALEGEFRLR